MKFNIEVEDDVEVLSRDIKKFGTSGHIVIPRKHIGKKAKVICQDEKENS